MSVYADFTVKINKREYKLLCLAELFIKKYEKIFEFVSDKLIKIQIKLFD